MTDDENDKQLEEFVEVMRAFSQIETMDGKFIIAVKEYELPKKRGAPLKGSILSALNRKNFGKRSAWARKYHQEVTAPKSRATAMEVRIAIGNVNRELIFNACKKLINFNTKPTLKNVKDLLSGDKNLHHSDDALKRLITQAKAKLKSLKSI